MLKLEKRPDDAARAKLLRRAAWFGAIAALLCQALPPEHRSVCTAIVKVASLTCGGS